MLKKFLIILFILILNLPAFAEDKIHVAFCIDNNYPIYTMLAINSILLNNTSNSKYCFHIVENNVSKFNKFHMEHFVKNRGADIEFIHFDTQSIDEGENIFSFKGAFCLHISRIGTARIMLPELLPNLDKILYLDADILVTNDLKKLWDTNLGKYYAAMCDDRSLVSRQKKIKINKEYYNSGVILMNAKLWRKGKVAEKIINYFKTEKYRYPDQDAINTILKGNILRLDPKYNHQVCLHFSTENNEPLSKDVIIHYITNDKPWRKILFPRMDYLMDFTQIYMKYWDKSYLVIYKPLHFLICFEKVKQKLAKYIWDNYYEELCNKNNYIFFSYDKVKLAIDFNNKFYCPYQGR